MSVGVSVHPHNSNLLLRPTFDLYIINEMIVDEIPIYKICMYVYMNDCINQCMYVNFYL